jgi:AcrR family transcriptional regulator
MDTRRRIIEVARELFASQSYAGTSIADITGRLGMSKAALYYHFSSKAEILSALVEEPLAAFAQLPETPGGAEDLLAAVVDTTAGYLDVVDTIGNDPSARAVLRELSQQHRADEVNAAIVAALAGPSPSVGRRARAHAAYAVAKHGTLSLTKDGKLDPHDRTEILAAAVRALDGPS